MTQSVVIGLLRAAHVRNGTPITITGLRFIKCWRFYTVYKQTTWLQFYLINSSPSLTRKHPELLMNQKVNRKHDWSRAFLSGKSQYCLWHFDVYAWQSNYLTNLFRCTCGNCIKMPNKAENLCCMYQVYLHSAEHSIFSTWESQEFATVQCIGGVGGFKFLCVQQVGRQYANISCWRQHETAWDSF